MASEIQKKWEEKIARAKKKKQDWMDQFQVEKLRAYLRASRIPAIQRKSGSRSISFTRT